MTKIKPIVLSGKFAARWVITTFIFLTTMLSFSAGGKEILLAQTLAGSVDVPAYWVSEKLDGVRATWNGQTLQFRSGRLVHAPAWFLAGLPVGTPLDGELWLRRESFDELSGIVRKAIPDDDEWRRVRYMVFELPDAPGSFSDRLAALREEVSRQGTAYLELIDQIRLPDRRALDALLRRVVDAGGEGLMLHRADAPYVTGRSDVLLKLKPWQDAEAVVVGYQNGRGKYRGMVGALRLRLPEDRGGRTFRVSAGLTDKDRHQPPAIGTSVTYRYTSLTPNGIPRFPRYWRVREEF